MKKNIVVTGAAGFLGTYFIKCLDTKKFNIYAIDTKKQKFPKVTFLRYNIYNLNKFLNRLPTTIHYLFHFAAIKDVNIAENDYNKTYNNNTYYTLLLITKLKNRIKNLIFTSSCSIYGNNKIPLKEKYQPLPINFYGVSKLAAENYILTLSNIYDIKSIILRIFNIYGYWSKTDTYQGVIVRFLKQLKNNLPITIFGSGNQSRDFISIYDICKILKSFLNRFPSHNILNVGSGKDITVNNLAQLLGKLLHIKPRKHFKPLNKFEIYKSLADTKKLRTYIDHKITFTSLQTGLKTLIQESKFS